MITPFIGKKQNFQTAKTSAIFDVLIAKCPNSAKVLQVLKDAECFQNSAYEMEMFADLLIDEAEAVADNFRTEASGPCAATLGHERMEAAL